tara:strand:+ start:1363 stop:1635 length:273 start_codon:yes stop_codon:yes gene_type:complete
VNDLYNIALCQTLALMATAGDNVLVDLHRQAPARQAELFNQLIDRAVIGNVGYFPIDSYIHDFTFPQTAGDRWYLPKNSAFRQVIAATRK